MSGEAAPPRAVVVPAAGDLAWPRYAELHDLAATLLAQWASLLESPQESYRPSPMFRSYHP